MSTATDPLLLIDSLHDAVDYIPKRAIRFFTAQENRQETIGLFIDEINEVITHPEEFVEEESHFLFYAIMILGHLRSKELIPFVGQIGRLDQQVIDELLGDRLFDSISLALAQIFSEDIDLLKVIIEDSSLDECIRATCLQSILYLYGQNTLSRGDVVAYFLTLFKKPRESIPLFYEVMVSGSLILHPLEMIDEIRTIFDQGILDSSDISREDVEEFLMMDKNEVVEECKESLQVDLEDLITYFDSVEALNPASFLERNEPCPCGSGQKYKKCCL